MESRRQGRGVEFGKGCDPADDLPVTFIKGHASLGFGSYFPKHEMDLFQQPLGKFLSRVCTSEMRTQFQCPFI